MDAYLLQCVSAAQTGTYSPWGWGSEGGLLLTTVPSYQAVELWKGSGWPTRNAAWGGRFVLRWRRRGAAPRFDSPRQCLATDDKSSTVVMALIVHQMQLLYQGYVWGWAARAEV